MATPLNKPVRRETQYNYAVLYQKPRQVVVSIEPGDLLTFREKGRQKKFALPIDLAFKIAVRRDAEQQRQEKKKQKVN